MRQIWGRRGPAVALTMDSVDQLEARLRNAVMRDVRVDMNALRSLTEQERRDRDLLAADIDRQLAGLMQRYETAIADMRNELGRIRQVVDDMHKIQEHWEKEIAAHLEAHGWHPVSNNAPRERDPWE